MIDEGFPISGIYSSDVYKRQGQDWCQKPGLTQSCNAKGEEGYLL